MAAGIEDRVEVFLPDAIEAKGVVELGFSRRVLLEPERKLGAELGFVALGVERRPPAFRRCERDLDAGVPENIVGGGELLQPESRFSSGVAQLVMRRDNHQRFHDFLLYD